ncbi:unnamed protein product [Caenorhabditis auriculariae]|uniref:HAT C-terminal dimerisation domain-containing protein n=1 Tax=Caenorhabditis auriculariae TaxID=2777116 RepID=A0A8S1HXS0_9PELO|nr:unnamed protein product [Caenorhabditis auriculariae]
MGQCVTGAPVPEAESSLCKPYISELNTLLPLQAFENKVVFFEVSYRGECSASDRLGFRNYRVLVVDTWHKSFRTPYVLFYGSFHLSKLRDIENVQHKEENRQFYDEVEPEFLVRSSSESPPPPEVGVANYKNGLVGGGSNRLFNGPLKSSIMPNALSRYLVPSGISSSGSVQPPPTKATPAESHPVIFILYDSNTDNQRKAWKTMEQNITYYRSEHRVPKQVEELRKIKPKDITFALEEAVDVIILDRDGVGRGEDGFVRAVRTHVPSRVTVRRVTVGAESLQPILSGGVDTGLVDFAFVVGKSLSRCPVVGGGVQLIVGQESPGQQNVCGLTTDVIAETTVIAKTRTESTFTMEDVQDEEVIDVQAEPLLDVPDHEGGGDSSSDVVQVVSPHGAATSSDDERRLREDTDGSDLPKRRLEESQKDEEGDIYVVPKRPRVELDHRSVDGNPLEESLQKEINQILSQKMADTTKKLHQIYRLLADSLPSMKADLETAVKNQGYKTTLEAEEIIRHGFEKRFAAAFERNFEADKKSILDAGLLPKLQLETILRGRAYVYFRPLLRVVAGSNTKELHVDCAVCSKYGTTNIKFKIAYPVEDAQKLLKDMKKHLDTTTHKDAVASYLAEREDYVQQRVEDSGLKKDGTLLDSSLRATDKMIALAFYSVKLVHSSLSFDYFVSAAEKMLGKPIGHHHRDRRTKCWKLFELSYSVPSSTSRNTDPFRPTVALILDSTTTKYGDQILLILAKYVDLHGLAHIRPLTLQEVKESETGEHVLAMVTDWFQKNGITNVLANQVSSVTTDGALNMQGKIKGFTTLLGTWVRGQRTVNRDRAQPLGIQHCLAHKLELAIADAYKKSSEGLRMREFTTKFINRLRSFFGTTAVKRRRVLDNSVMLRRAHLFKLKGIISVRWATSELVAVKSLIELYDEVLITLHTIAKNPNEFDQPARAKAVSMLATMKDGKFFAYLVFSIDMLGAVSILSKQLQSEAMPLSYSVQAVDDTKSALRKLEQPAFVTEATLGLLQRIGVQCVGSDRKKRQLITDKSCLLTLFQGWANRKDLMHPDPYWIAFKRKEKGEIVAQSKTDAEWDISNYLFAPGGVDPQGFTELRDQLLPTIDAAVKLANNEMEKNKRKRGHATKEDAEHLEDLTLYKNFQDVKFPHITNDVRKEIVENYIEHIDERFVGDEVTSSLIAFTPDEVFKISNDPNYNPAVPSKHRKILYSYMVPQVDANDAESALRLLSTQLGLMPTPLKEEFSLVRRHPSLLLAFFYRHKKFLNFPKILSRVFVFVLSFSASSAPAERGFSIINHLMDPPQKPYNRQQLGD